MIKKLISKLFKKPKQCANNCCQFNKNHCCKNKNGCAYVNKITKKEK